MPVAGYLFISFNVMLVQLTSILFQNKLVGNSGRLQRPDPEQPRPSQPTGTKTSNQRLWKSRLAKGSRFTTKVKTVAWLFDPYPLLLFHLANISSSSPTSGASSPSTLTMQCDGSPSPGLSPNKVACTGLVNHNDSHLHCDCSSRTL